MEHFYVKDAQAAEDKQIPDALPVLEEKTDDAPANADPGIGYIFEHTRGKSVWFSSIPGKNAKW